MVDFPVCPSFERTMSVLPHFAYPSSERAKLQCSLFAGTLYSLKDRTAQSLRPSGPAPFTQGSLSRVHPRTLERYRAGQTQMKPTACMPTLLALYTRDPLPHSPAHFGTIQGGELSIFNCPLSIVKELPALGNRQLVAAVVFFVLGVALDPVAGDPVKFT